MVLDSMAYWPNGYQEPRYLWQSVQDHWKELEKQWIIEQKARDDKCAALKGNEEAAKAAESEVTNEALARSERLFGYFKNYEAQMQAQLAAAET